MDDNGKNKRGDEIDKAEKIEINQNFGKSSQKSFFYSSTIDHTSAGIIAAFASTILLHPLDLIKIRLQVDSKTSTQDIIGRSVRALSEVLNTGKTVDLVQRVSVKDRILSLKNLYNYIKQQMSTGKTYHTDAKGASLLSAPQHLLASSMAGILTQLVANPFWVVKVRMCAPPTQNDYVKYNGVVDGIIKLARYEGMRGLYKGLFAGIIGVSHGALQFMAYEEMKKYLVKTDKYKNSTSIKFDTKEYLLMSTLSKLFASSLTYPYQVVRTRMQRSTTADKYSSVVSTITHIYRSEGWHGFYKGLGPNTIRVLPGTMITFLVYENVSTFYRSRSS
ncbi:hypothetical protein BB559_000667 [Furculomyces boomerangus]|uniref:Uncharacterized protein n=2 Tax=Harpellales TaxID=61421 RepID=A0A2T9Z4H2_9FUNG|nr:hypothetical protein BB559_000667 [Furculomyces boomerangus]PVZ97299.1 hypothetical protein BB558_006755 [Smittium angustum]